MSRGARWWGVAVLVAVVGLLLWGQRSSGGGGSSALSRGSAGWLAARRWLELGGRELRLLDLPLSDDVAADVVVIACPARRPLSADERTAAARLIAAGATVVYGYSGQLPAAVELTVADGLGLELEEVREPPSLAPTAWWRWAGQSAELVPVQDGGDQNPPVVVTAPTWMPRVPAEATVLYADATGRGAVFAVPRGRGRLVVLPTEALANGRLDQAGNQDLLAFLGGLGDSWLLDEYRHGLTAPATTTGGAPTRALDALGLHLLLCYLLGVLALARRFGPVWRPEVTVPGSTASFLLAIGHLHDRLGHHRAAAQLLVARARTLEPGLRLGAPEGDVDGDGFLRLARRVARHQRSGARTAIASAPGEES